MPSQLAGPMPMAEREHKQHKALGHRSNPGLALYAYQAYFFTPTPLME